MRTIKLRDGYDRRKESRLLTFHAMTISEALSLYSGERVWFRCNDGKARQLTVNGKVRTWKRDPLRVEIPIKYGMYEFATLKSLPDQGIMERLLVLEPENPPDTYALESDTKPAE